MAKLRKGVSYRKIERPYTRISKYREKSFIRTARNIRVVRFEMGETNRKFGYTLNLRSKADLQIRHNAIEAARQSSNRLLEKVLGKTGYFMKIRIYPHHVLRENPLASGAGADRMSTGMQKSFGKPIGFAAQVREGKTLVSLSVDKQNLETAKKALKRFAHKVPCRTTIETVTNA
jgi:large subunit ribosomal protein L10e